MTVIRSTSDLIPDGISGYRKALGAFFVAGAALVTDAWADGSITQAEWKTIVIGSVVAGVTAFFLPNAVKPTTTVGPTNPV